MSLNESAQKHFFADSLAEADITLFTVIENMPQRQRRYNYTSARFRPLTALSKFNLKT